MGHHRYAQLLDVEQPCLLDALFRICAGWWCISGQDRAQAYVAEHGVPSSHSFNGRRLFNRHMSCACIPLRFSVSSRRRVCVCDVLDACCLQAPPSLMEASQTCWGCSSSCKCHTFHKVGQQGCWRSCWAAVAYIASCTYNSLRCSHDHDSACHFIKTLLQPRAQLTVMCLLVLLLPSHLAGVGGLLRLLCPVTGGLMWRTAKAEVSGEMGIPPQHHHTTVLRLSAIERHWYNRSVNTTLQQYVQDMCMRRTACICLCVANLHICALGCSTCGTPPPGSHPHIADGGWTDCHARV